MQASTSRCGTMAQHVVRGAATTRVLLPLPARLGCNFATPHATMATFTAAARPARRLLTIQCSSKRDGKAQAPFYFKDERLYVNVPNVPEFWVPTSLLWQFAFPLAGYLAVAAVVGPLVIGMAISALAVGAAIAAGAVAMGTLFLPLFMLMGFSMLMFGGVSVGFAALFMPAIFAKAASFFIAAVGLGAGFVAMNWVLPALRGASRAGDSADDKAGNGTSSSGRSSKLPDSKPEEDELEKEVRQMARELRDFDTLLAEREEKRRVEKWRQQ